MVVLLILLAGCADRGVTVASDGVTVPNVVGLPTEKATARVEAVNLVPSVICEVDRKEADIVIAQEPLGGTMAARASKVKITGGAQTCERPRISSISTTTTSASGLVPALQTNNPTVTVTPSSNLVDGQQVHVTVTGFGQGGKFYLSECASPADANDAGCGNGLPVQPFGSTDNSGDGSMTFQVRVSAAVLHDDLTDIQPCTDQCVLVATVGIGYGYAYTPLSFADG
jgi:hypothetical protein